MKIILQSIEEFKQLPLDEQVKVLVDGNMLSTKSAFSVEEYAKENHNNANAYEIASLLGLLWPEFNIFETYNEVLEFKEKYFAEIKDYKTTQTIEKKSLMIGLLMRFFNYLKPLREIEMILQHLIDEV